MIIVGPGGIVNVGQWFVNFQKELKAIRKQYGAGSPEYQAKVAEASKALSGVIPPPYVPKEGESATQKVILAYVSKSHGGKRRYFTHDPSSNPKKDGKPGWSYEKKYALALSRQEASAVKFYLAASGYKAVEEQKAQPALQVIAGGKVAALCSQAPV